MNKPIDTIVSIPSDVLAEVDLRLWDPLRSKIRYGSRSALIVGLLRGWLKEQGMDTQAAAEPEPEPSSAPDAA